MAIIILNNECINVPSGVANEIANLRLEVSRLTTSDTSLEDACEEITTLRQQLEESEKQRDEFSVLCGMLTENGLDTFNREAILQEQLAQYKADAERLDWLETQGMIGIGHTQWGEYRYYAGDMFKPIREVIDSAIAGKKKDNSE